MILISMNDACVWMWSVSKFANYKLILSVQWSQIFSKDDKELPKCERGLQEGYREVQEEA